MWQDYVIATVSVLFGFILLPQLRDVWHGQVLNIFTAGLTTLGLFILVYTFYTMDYMVSTFSSVFSAMIWMGIFVLSIKNKKKQG